MFTNIIEVINNNNIEEVKRLIRLDPNIVNVRFGHINLDYITPLVMAARCNLIEIVRLLLDNGADIEAKDGGLNNALDWVAANNGDINIDKLLIKKGCKLDEQDESGNTALIHASIHFNIDRIKLLILAGCNIELKDHYGYTFMDYINKDNQNSKYIPEIKRLIESRKTLLWKCVNYVKKNRSKFKPNSLKSLNKDIRQLL